MRLTLISLEMKLRKVKEHLIWNLRLILEVLWIKFSVIMIGKQSDTLKKKLTKHETSWINN